MPEPREKQLLLDAAKAAVADAKSKADEDEKARVRASTPASRSIMFSASVVLFAASIYLAVARPAWFIRPPLPPDPPVIQDASVRLTVVREAQRINAYRVTSGRLPASLAEAGAAVAGLTYARINDSVFALSLPIGVDRMTFRSTDSVAVFLGDAVATVSARGGK
jgi:hypothetical protein